MMGDLKKGKPFLSLLTYVVLFWNLSYYPRIAYLQAENTHSVLAVADKSTISISCA